MAADQTIGVTNQGAGSKVDVSEITRSDGVVVERQRIAIGDANGGDAVTGRLAAVRGEANDQNTGLVVAGDSLEVLQSIDSTLKEIKLLLRICVDNI